MAGKYGREDYDGVPGGQSKKGSDGMRAGTALCLACGDMQGSGTLPPRWKPGEHYDDHRGGGKEGGGKEGGGAMEPGEAK